MSGLLDLLDSPMGKQIVNGISAQTGESEGKTADLLGMAVPVLVGAMKKNATSEEGSKGLMNALSGKHDGGVLDNLTDLFAGGVDKKVMDDGSGILGHVLGNKQPEVENALSAKSGISTGSIGQILKIAAPIVMGFLGKQRAQNNVNDSSGLSGLLGGMLSGQSEGNQNLLTNLLDQDGDGSVLDDVAGMVFGGKKGKGGLLGGLLG